MCTLIDTEAVLPAQRLHHWHQKMLEAVCVDLRITNDEATEFRSLARTHTFGSVRIIQWSGSPGIVHCGLAEGGPDVLAVVPLKGSCIARKGGRSTEFARERIGIIPIGEPCELLFAAPYEVIVLGLPRHRVPALGRIGGESERFAIPVAHDTAVLFVNFAAAFVRNHEDLSARENTRAMDTIVDMLDGALRAYFGERERSRRDLHHRERIVALVEKELANPALDAAFIARAVGLSVRHVRRLFADDAVPLMQWILEQRLERCFGELCDPASGARLIGEIAFSWGFNDQSHFSRVFRKRFGMMPSALRASAAGRRAG